MCSVFTIGFDLFLFYVNQLSKTADGIKVVTDKGEEIIADVVLFATGI